MNKNFSEVIIEINGNEYTLFINRVGIVNWEKNYGIKEKAEDIEKKYKTLSEKIEITDDYDPFAADYDIDAEEEEMKKMYSRFYHMALYKNHKFTIAEADELFNKAVEEYGLQQLADLANQMVEEANIPSQNLKNLKALKSTK